MRPLIQKLRSLFRRDRLNEDLADEMQLHVDLRARRLAERGMASDEARRIAQQQFGSRLGWAEQSQWAWGFPRVEDILQDVRYGARGLRRNPVFSITAIAIIAVGIGASAAVFSVVDRLLFRSLPYPNSERLVSIGIEHPMFVTGEFLVSNDYFHLREQTAVFEALASGRGTADCDLTESNPLRLSCVAVESRFLPTFGIVPVLGRNFTAEEDQPNAPKVALISSGLWESRFAGSPAVLGKTIPVDGAPVTILGVLPRDFEMPGLERVDLVISQGLKEVPYVRGGQGGPVRVFGRLREGVTISRAAAALGPFFESATEFMPRHMKAQATIRLRSIRDYQIHDVKLSSWVLFGATFAILLMVCANVANLLLARSAARQREFAVRTALGAGRGRLIRLNLAESMLVSAAGASAGCGVAWLLLRVVKVLGPAGIPRLQQAALDARALLFTVALMVVCGVLLGFAPAAAAPRAEMLAGRGSGSSGRTGLRRLLTTAQVAISLILICDAGLLIESLQRMQGAVTRLDGGQVVTANIVVGAHRYPNALARQQFFDSLVERLRLNPVASVALSDTVPPSGFVHTTPLSNLVVPGERPRENGEGGIVAWRQVTPDYFKTLGIPLLRGRGFREDERFLTDRTIILSASLARILFYSQEALGRSVRVRGRGEYTVVGIAADVDNNGIPGHGDPEYYVLWKKVTDPQAGPNISLVARSLNVYDGDAWVGVRSSAPPDAIANWIRTEAAALDSTVPVTIATMEQRLRGVSARPRFSAFLLTLFAAIGVLLAASGLYGLISFLVVKRTPEIGVRMALGATPWRIVRLVVHDAVRWTALGIAGGLVGAAASTRALRGLLFEAPAQQPAVFGAAAALLLLVALTASLLPSLRAAQTDPVQALRRD